MLKRLIACLSICLLEAVALAQSMPTSTLTGKVTFDGSPLPGVKVVVSSPQLQGARTAVTTPAGDFIHPFLPPGDYTVRFELSGMQTAERKVTLAAARTEQVRVELRPASVTQAVTVTAETIMTAAIESTQVSTNLRQDLIDNLPVARNLQSVVLLAPGVNANGPGGNVVISGAMSYDSLYLVNGAIVNENLRGQAQNLFIEDAIQETTVLTGGISAEYGHFTGGVVNMITKSGGNEFKGVLEAYYQPDSFVSDNSPDTDDETFTFEDYALSLGGPIAKDKLWFFGSVEYWHQETTPVGAMDTSDRKIPRFLGKLTYQLNEKNRIFGMGEYDHVVNERRGIDAYTFPEAAPNQDGPNATFAVNWESILSSSSFLNVKVTGYDGNDDFLPYAGHGVAGREAGAETAVAQQVRQRQGICGGGSGRAGQPPARQAGHAPAGPPCRTQRRPFPDQPFETREIVDQPHAAEEDGRQRIEP